MGRFSVLLDDFQRSITNRTDKVTVCPQRWQAGFQVWKLRPQGAGRCSFHGLYELMNATLRFNFNQQMHMIRHDLQFQNFRFVF